MTSEIDRFHIGGHPLPRVLTSQKIQQLLYTKFYFEKNKLLTCNRVLAQNGALDEKYFITENMDISDRHNYATTFACRILTYLQDAGQLSKKPFNNLEKIADFLPDATNLSDIVYAFAGTRNITASKLNTVKKNTISYTFHNKENFGYTANYMLLTQADFNNDGKEDLLFLTCINADGGNFGECFLKAVTPGDKDNITTEIDSITLGTW